MIGQIPTSQAKAKTGVQCGFTSGKVLYIYMKNKFILLLPFFSSRPFILTLLVQPSWSGQRLLLSLRGCLVSDSLAFYGSINNCFEIVGLMHDNTSDL